MLLVVYDILKLFWTSLLQIWKSEERSDKFCFGRTQLISRGGLVTKIGVLPRCARQQIHSVIVDDWVWLVYDWSNYVISESRLPNVYFQYLKSGSLRVDKSRSVCEPSLSLSHFVNTISLIFLPLIGVSYFSYVRQYNYLSSLRHQIN